jgi:hypothetical protein
MSDEGAQEHMAVAVRVVVGKESEVGESGPVTGCGVQVAGGRVRGGRDGEAGSEVPAYEARGRAQAAALLTQVEPAV